MKIKKCIIIGIILIFACCLSAREVFASTQPTAPTISTITSDMSDVGEVDLTSGGSKIGNIINAVINLIQFAGSGIAVIVVTMLGAKYMMASSSEKADIKKQAMPIVIGCVVLFAAVNLVGIVADIGVGLDANAGATTGNNPGATLHPDNQGITH